MSRWAIKYESNDFHNKWELFKTEFNKFKRKRASGVLMRANFSEKGEFKFGKFDYEKAREIAQTTPNLSSITTRKRWRMAARLAATTALLDAGARRVSPAHFFRKLNRPAK